MGDWACLCSSRWKGSVSADQLGSREAPCLLSLRLGWASPGPEAAHPSGNRASFLPWVSVSLLQGSVRCCAEPGPTAHSPGEL